MAMPKPIRRVPVDTSFSGDPIWRWVRARPMGFPGAPPVSFGPKRPYALGKANILVYDSRKGILVPAPPVKGLTLVHPRAFSETAELTLQSA